MNALVASVIRTIVPIAVGQVASWFLLLHAVLPANAQLGLSTFLGGALSGIYYLIVRVIEQQWPLAGILLGLPSSPDTYSKDTQTAAVPEAPTKTLVDPLTSILTAAPSISVQADAPAKTFPAAQVDAASASETPVASATA
jgi:hypothetical protein